MCPVFNEAWIDLETCSSFAFSARFFCLKDWLGLLVILRMGGKQGFKDIKQGQCHSVGTKAMQMMAANVHENVENFDEVLCCCCCFIPCFSFLFLPAAGVETAGADCQFEDENG